MNRFSKHELKIEAENQNFKSYLCKNSNFSEDWFRIIFAPNLITVYGDFGNLVLRTNYIDSLAWLLNLDKSFIDFIMNKVLCKLNSSLKEYSKVNAVIQIDDLYDVDSEIIAGVDEHIHQNNLILSALLKFCDLFLNKTKIKNIFEDNIFKHQENNSLYL